MLMTQLHVFRQDVPGDPMAVWGCDKKWLSPLSPPQFVPVLGHQSSCEM